MKSSRPAGGACVGSKAVRPLRTVAAVVAVAVAGTVACAPAGLGRAGNPDAVAAAVARSVPVASRPVNQAGRPLAYLALGGTRGPRLAAFDLARSRLLWQVPAHLTGRAVAGASIVVHGDGGALVAHEVATGAERWRAEIPHGEHLVGYAADGDQIYFVARSGNELRGGEGELVALAGSSGAVRWRRALGTANVGGPAARGGVVAVLNRSQFVTLVDGANGEPMAQALSKEQAANFVEATPEGFFYGFGSDGAYLLSRETAVGVRASPGFLHAQMPPFVRPVYHFDMYRPELMDYSAIDRNRLLWRAAVDGSRATFADDTVCVLNYRFFFGFDASNGSLRWAYNHPLMEAASATHTGPSIVFVTTDGEFGALDPRTGQRTYQSRLSGEVVTGATFDAQGFSPSGGDVPESPSLSAALSSIVWDPDRRFSEVKIFAVDQLAGLPGREVTENLLKVLGHGDMPPAVIKRAATALVDRKDPQGGELIVAAIGVHSDYVTDVKSANVDVLARAAGSWRARQAAGPLAEHLRRPETEPAEVIEIARALVAMGAAETLPALRDYLAMYRADPAYERAPAALLVVADALIHMGGDADRQWLLYLSEEPRTLAPLREHARRALEQTASPRPPSKAAAPAATAPSPSVPSVAGH